MIDGRWLKIIDENGTKDINEYISRFIFLDAKASYPVSVEDSITMKGVDGELPSVASFAPFNLMVKFGFDGIDEIDINLMEQKLRNIFYKRTPYYIVTSDNPGIKYKVNNPDMNPDYADFSTTRFEMTFSVKDGYSESYLKTDEMSLSNQNDWQFGNGYLAFDESDDFHHRTKKFRIYNGSSDTIDPTLRHTLNITVHANAPKGFKIRSLTTGDEFEYTGNLGYTDTFMLKGVYPVKNGSRVGTDTNMSWLTLEKGFNYFIVEGEGLSDFDITFSFNFIYR
ncbi:MAG: phage tail family protein [Staphylococcus equorum]|uniref:phage tail domain-containing protein n=1 Tax=Staphylococcus TaxID=1279 RepID=UPI0025540523|nr:phage tail domain-containing protein [Staphylococcus equorum]MDK9870679.1 phage tail family protein [Staphylococcus equorum]MDK9876077.1 phage tail family protein [Staphylococcus equorum]MDN6570297.1 phage tail family protein [Staphylococcus equorum]MDN6611514.1 phage tail family protein [Staphylococcus equorum]MDN6742119.1 phage tail family protein [Staphylococcus equorum]